MFNIHSVEIDWGGRPLRLETGKIARQADGAVLATYGETVVLATVVAAKNARDGVDFLPLTVDYIEKTYAAGRIPGGYFKREGRPDREGNAGFPPDRPSDPPACSSTAGATRPRSSSPCCRMTWRTIPTFWRWLPPPRR